jgi:hypothetical protein
MSELSIMEAPLEFRSEPPGAPEMIDRRRSARHACDSQLYLAPMGTKRQNAWSASLRDLSTKGIGLTLNRRFELGATLTIEWCPFNRAKLPSLVARVIRVFHMPDNTWWHGCELIGDIDSEELAAFLAASQAAAEAPVHGELIGGEAAWPVVAELHQTITDADRETNSRLKR